MKTLMKVVAVVALGAFIAGCDKHRTKHKGNSHKGKVENGLPGDRSVIAPNCAADGPGCRQFRPDL